MKFTILEHVRHRWDHDEGPWSYTRCGILFIGLVDAPPDERNRAHHEPEQSRCPTCYPA